VFKSFKGEEKPALFSYGAIVSLQDRVPKEMFEFFNLNNAAVFLEESELKLKEIDQILKEGELLISDEKFRNFSLFKAKIAEEKDKIQNLSLQLFDKISDIENSVE
jgi:hypothetical protein